MTLLQNIGERMIPDYNQGSLGYVEHFSRYFFAEQFVKDKIILDIACGVGYGSLYLREKGAKIVYGVDISQDAIDYAKSKYYKNGIEFKVGNAENIPLENSMFDIIVSFETIEHLKDEKRFLQEVKRVLKKNGLAIFSTPNALVYPKGNMYHTREFTTEDLNKLLLQYFKNIKPFFQDTILSNYILGEDTCSRENHEIPAKSLKISKYNTRDALYLVYLASDNTIPPIKESITLFDKSVLQTQEKRLYEIYNSRGWKILTLLHKIRKSIPIIKHL